MYDTKRNEKVTLTPGYYFGTQVALIHDCREAIIHRKQGKHTAHRFTYSALPTYDVFGAMKAKYLPAGKKRTH